MDMRPCFGEDGTGRMGVMDFSCGKPCVINVLRSMCDFFVNA